MSHFRSTRSSVRAFTLIELLTVIAIIGILAAILIPTVSKVRSSAHSARCVSNLRQIGLQITLYAGDSKGQLPELNALTDSAVLDPRVIDHSGKQLAYRLWPYYTKTRLTGVPPTPRNVSVHELFICPAKEGIVREKIRTGPYPTSVDEKSANVMQSYIINDVQDYVLNGRRYTVFGYGIGGAGTSMNLYTIERVLRMTDQPTALSRIWAIQDADRTLSDGSSLRTTQVTFVSETPSHGNNRNRLFLDGSVRSLSLKDSTEGG